MADNNKSIYTEEELAILKKTQDIRLRIMDAMTKDGVPTRSGDIRVLNEVMSAADKMAVDSALIRVKHEEAQNAGAIAEMAAELLKRAHAKKLQYATQGDIPEIPQELTQVEVVEGETDLNPEPLNPDDFVAPKFDPSKAGE